MKSKSRLVKSFATLLGAILIAGCSSIPGMDSVLPDRKVEYKKSRQSENNLEIPPDLSRTTISDELVIPGGAAVSPADATLVGLQQQERRGGRVAGRTQVLPEIQGIEVERDADKRWLLIQGDPEDVWYKVLEFWQENGILLEEQDPATGVMVTDWLEERPNIDIGLLPGLISKAVEGLHTASTRDQYRIRIEPGTAADTTELYLTHRGMQEMVIQDARGQVERTVWNPRDSDPGLEAEFLRRLMVYLGTSDEQATQALAAGNTVNRQPRSRLNKTGDTVALEINEDADRAWRLVGVGLDRVGFAVEDRDRDAGVYYVRYYDPMKNQNDEGFFSKLAFWSSDDANIDKESQYQVKLQPVGDTTEVVVLNEQGQRENSETAQRILTLLHEQIR